MTEVVKEHRKRNHSGENRPQRRSKADTATIYIDSDDVIQQQPDSTVDSHHHKSKHSRENRHSHRHKPRDANVDDLDSVHKSGHKHTHSEFKAKFGDETEGSSEVRKPHHKRKHSRESRHSGEVRHGGDFGYSGEPRHSKGPKYNAERRHSGEPRHGEAPTYSKYMHSNDDSKHKHRSQRHGHASSAHPSPSGEMSRKMTLSERFSDPCDEFTFDENISIGIHRQISSRTAKPNAKVVHEIDLDLFMLSRRRDEGRIPMFMREEILKFCFDDRLEEQLDEEKRVIKVDRREKRNEYKESYITRTVPVNDRWNYRGGYSGRPWHMGPPRGWDQGDRRNLNIDNSGKETLPDFSKRPDRYMFDDRFMDPEAIPKGRDYFDHDDREDYEPVRYRGNMARGRWRGGSRGRGRGRAYNRQQQDSGGKWQHDMFEKIAEKEEPSSTTAV